MLILLLLFATPLWAAEQNNLSPRSYQQLQRLQKLLADNDYSAAKRQLEALHSSAKGNAFESAWVAQGWGYFHLQQEQHTQAIERFDEALRSGLLPESEQQQLRYLLAQLWMLQGQYPKATVLLESWLQRADAPKPEAYILLASAYSEQQHYRKAIPLIKQAIAKASKPEESWYQLLLAAHYELTQYDACVRVLKQLIERYPGKAEYWWQLAAMHLAQEQYRSALAVLGLAEQQGWLEKRQAVDDLARLYLQQGVPLRAARLLRRAEKVDPWLLVNAWLQAREFDTAIELLETTLHQHSNGEFALLLGRLYAQQRRWERLVELLPPLLVEESPQRGELQLLLGEAYLELDRIPEALEQFRLASHSAPQRQRALAWLAYLDR